MRYILVHSVNKSEINKNNNNYEKEQQSAVTRRSVLFMNSEDVEHDVLLTRIL